MFKEGTIVYEMESQYIKTNRTSGKEYKVWVFTARTSITEDLEKVNSKRKGKWLIVETPDGLVRYNMESGHKVTYKMNDDVDVKEEFEIDPNIQKMRDMGFPEWMITFDTPTPSIPFKRYTIYSDDWEGIRDIHNYSIESIINNTETDDEKLIKEHLRKTQYSQLDSLTKEQLIHIIIEHEMTLNSIMDDLGILDEKKEDEQ
jgi:hypothetical protein